MPLFGILLAAVGVTCIVWGLCQLWTLCLPLDDIEMALNIRLLLVLLTACGWTGLTLYLVYRSMGCR